MFRGLFQNEKYQINNVRHREKIENEIYLFTMHHRKLKNIDNKLSIAASLDILLWLTGAINTGFNVVGLLAIVFYAREVEHRAKHVTAFQEQLTTLLNLYEWCAKAGPSMTHDPVFLKLLETISPYTWFDQLIPWDINQMDPSDLSSEFKIYLADSPHRVLFLMKQKPAMKKFIAKAQELIGPPIEIQALCKEGIKSNKWYSIFNQSLSELNRAVYGVTPETDLKMPRPAN